MPYTTFDNISSILRFTLLFSITQITQSVKNAIIIMAFISQFIVLIPTKLS